jgi:hypothetical protein
LATARLDIAQPSVPDEAPPADVPAEGLSSSAHPGSLIEDVEALVEDGKTYAQAELAYQKSRLAFAVDHAKWAAIMGVLAVVLVILAIVALVVGALIALIPPLGPWGATGVVFGVLAVGAAVLVALAKAHISSLTRAFGEDGE